MSSQLEERLRDALADSPAPDEAGAARRSWRVIEAAHAERSPVRPSRSRRPALRLAFAAALLALGLGAAFSPAGAAVGEWIEERVGLAPDEAQPTLRGFPQGGRLLAVSDSGAWRVDPGGALRRLGGYRELGWSPRGLYVIGTRGRRVTAMEPSGEPRWSIVRPGRVSRPAWSGGDGYRVAYLETRPSGRTLRVADGSGQLDHAVAAGAAAVTPAWRPGRGYTVSYVRTTSNGRTGQAVATVDADTGARLWSARIPARPLDLAWSRDGRGLVILLPDALQVRGRDGRLRAELPLPARSRARALALHPSGRRAAVALSRDGDSQVVVTGLTGEPVAWRRLFSGPGTFSELEWSPDGRRLLVAWPEANQWLLIGRGRARAFSRVSRQLDPGVRGAGFPRLSGWCCSR